MKRGFIMIRRMIVVCGCVLALALVACSINAIPASAAAPGEWKVPEDGKWFAGIIEGKVVSLDARDSSVVLKIEKIVETRPGNRAKNPNKLKGQKAVILPRVVIKDGRLLPDDTQLAFVRDLKVGSGLRVVILSDGMARFRMAEVPTVLKKK